jgi:hypothetical protein
MNDGIDNTLLNDKSKMNTGALVQRAHSLWGWRYFIEPLDITAEEPSLALNETDAVELTEILNELYCRHVIAPQMEKAAGYVSNHKN